MVDLAVLVVLALIGAPLIAAGRRQIELLHRVGGEIPEARAAPVLRRRHGAREHQHPDRQGQTSHARLLPSPGFVPTPWPTIAKRFTADETRGTPGSRLRPCEDRGNPPSATAFNSGMV